MYAPFILRLIFSHLFFSKDFIIKESQKTSKVFCDSPIHKNLVMLFSL